MLDASTILFWLILALLGYTLVTSMFSVLGARVHFETRRHDLLVRSKQLRLEYFNSLEEKMAGVEDDDEILTPEAPEPAGSIGPADHAPAKAA